MHWSTHERLIYERIASMLSEAERDRHLRRPRAPHLRWGPRLARALRALAAHLDRPTPACAEGPA